MSNVGIATTITTTVAAFVTLSLAAGPPRGSGGLAVSPDRAAVAATYEYVGTKKCRMCHTKQYNSLLDSPKGHAWEALLPGVSPAVKIKAGLDLKADYRTDGRCLACHSVGYGKPGGYVIPGPNDGRSERRAKTREGVGCESCHGAGSGFVPIMRDILRNQREYRVDELEDKGHKTVGPEVCGKCHNNEAICMVGVDARDDGATGTNGSDRSHGNRSWLHVDVADRQAFHAKFPLKYRISEGAARGGFPNEPSSANDKPSSSLKSKEK